MSNSIKNIVRICIVGILLVGVSRVTVVIHHDHPIDTFAKENTEHVHNEQTDEHQQSNSSTYHEVHFVKFGSDDNFTISPTTECRASFVTLFIIRTEIFDLIPTFQSPALVSIADKETGPPSVDKCALFSRFLI